MSCARSWPTSSGAPPPGRRNPRTRASWRRVRWPRRSITPSPRRCCWTKARPCVRSVRITTSSSSPPSTRAAGSSRRRPASPPSRRAPSSRWSGSWTGARSGPTRSRPRLPSATERRPGTSRGHGGLTDARGPRRRGAGRRPGGDARRRGRGRARRTGRGAARGHRRAAGGPASRVGAPRRRGVIVRRDRGGPRSRSRHRALAAAPRAPAIEGEAGAVRMTCTETRDLVSALADDALTPAERAALDAHLAGCADCRRELAGLLRTVKLVRAIDPARAPAGFVDRVRAAARPEPAPKRLARRLRAPWQTLPLGAAALFLIAGLAVLLFRGSHEQQQAARYQPTTPGPAAQAPTAPPRETGSSATTATRESTPAAPPARSRKLETAKNRVEQPAPAEPRAETTAKGGSPPRDTAPAAPEGRRAKVDSSERAQAPAGERFSSTAEDARADATTDAAKAGKLRQEPPAFQSPPPFGASRVAPSVAAKSQTMPQVAPLSRTGPMTG